MKPTFGTSSTVICLVIFFAFGFAFLIYTDTIQFDYKSRLPLLDLRSISSAPCLTGSSAPLRVYMYELPRRFHVGMMQKGKHVDDNAAVTADNLPPWPERSGLRKQHSVEYWMMASLLYNANGDEENATTASGEAVRVLDPDSADVFFVPFFSSLSFNIHGHTMTDPETEIDKQLQADLIDILRRSQYWQRSAGRDHVIPMHHPNAFRFHRGQLNDTILIVADFGRYHKSLANLRKDVVAPYVHIVDSFVDDNSPDPYASRETLLFFRGKTIRKDEGKIRAKLEQVLAGYEDVIYEKSDPTGEGVNASIQGMQSSKFCLNPAGDTPSSCRLFDAIVSHCVPVIVSDHIELPFEDELDYSKFSIFFSVKDALKPDYMVSELRKISKVKWVEMWRWLKIISHHFEYQYPPKKEDAVNMIWRQVKHKVPAANLAVHRSRRLKVPDWWK
ncbi:probable arabinosyltransferase ARAD1 [Coffea eugenioides]|nr:probable arabinosyltransferase ARAD1 [Coffea eugenioides]